MNQHYTPITIQLGPEELEWIKNIHAKSVELDPNYKPSIAATVEVGIWLWLRRNPSSYPKGMPHELRD